MNKISLKIYEITKRTFDIVFSLSVLILFAPIFLFIALLIKKSSPGPILYRQKKLGLDAKDITVYKFRTMYIESIELPLSKSQDIKSDVRVTKIGKFLRKSTLDELPMFLNVLKGDISIIGPSAIMPFEEKCFDDKEKIRFKVKPGITGYWQAYSRSHKYSDMAKMDIEYVNKQSTLLDLKIIFKTIWIGLKGYD